MVDCKYQQCGEVFKVKSAYYQKTRKYCSRACSNILIIYHLKKDTNHLEGL